MDKTLYHKNILIWIKQNQCKKITITTTTVVADHDGGDDDDDGGGSEISLYNMIM